MVLIFDFYDTLYDTKSNRLYEQTEMVLGELKQMQHNLFLIEAGGNDLEQRLNELGIMNFFDKVYMVERKISDEFEEIQSTYDTEKDFYVIGDSLDDEIQIGNMVGLTTVWYNPDKKPLPENLPVMNQPRYQIESLYDLMPIMP